MPKFVVQLKQGRDVKSVEVEASNYSNVLQFFETVTTMKVSEIREVVYINPSTIIPLDDFNYFPTFKTILQHESPRVARPLLLNNIKLTLDEREIFSLMKQLLKVDGLSVDSITATVFKSPLNS